MKLNTESRSRRDVLQYAIDDVWAVKTLTFAAPIPADLVSGDAIDATGTKVVAASTTCFVVADPQTAGSQHCVIFDKLVNLLSYEIHGSDPAGTTKALELLAANPFIRLV